jgi:poly(A) polymerase
MVPRIFKGLMMPLNEKMKYVQKLVRLHLRPIALVDDGVTDSAVRRLLFDAGNDIDDLMLLCNADITSKNPAKVARLRRNFELVKAKMAEVEAKDEIRNWKNPITGDYIMKVFGLEPCNTIGQLKEMVKDAVLDGKIPYTFEAADAYMREKAAEVGLKAHDWQAHRLYPGHPAVFPPDSDVVCRCLERLQRLVRRRAGPDSLPPEGI